MFSKQKLKILYLFVSLSLLSSTKSFSVTNTQNLTVLAKVWGLLKYYTPTNKDSQIDWDSVLINNIPLFDRELTQGELNTQVEKLILSFNSRLNACLLKEVNNSSTAWITMTPILTRSNQKRLLSIACPLDTAGSYYAQRGRSENIDFKNEKKYKGMLFPDSNHRLLALFRAWNAVNYFYPYKPLMDRSLDSVLPDLIVEMKQASDTLDYHLVLKKFSSTLCDSHANLSFSSFLYKEFPKRVEINIRYIENEFVIISSYGTCASLLKKGDVITEINNLSIDKLSDSLKLYYNASNLAVTMSGLGFVLLSGKNDSLQLEINDGHNTHTVTVPRVEPSHIKRPEPKATVSTFENGTILYLRSRPRKISDLDSILSHMAEFNGIVIDLRTISPAIDFSIWKKYFIPKSKAFARINVPDPSRPGTFIPTTLEPDDFENPEYYKGKLVILVNEYTQSYMEYATMFIKLNPNTTIIGSNTAGADGDTNRISLPGNFRLVFSGKEVLWPDGLKTQRIGIVPDIFVRPTIEDIKNSNDRVLEIALDYIRNQ